MFINYCCHFPMVAPICRSIQLPFIYLNLFPILVPSGRFSCRSQVSYHIFVCFYFTTRTRAIRLAKRKLYTLSIVSRRARRPISLTLVPIDQSNLDMSLLLLLQLQGCTTANAHPIGPILQVLELSLHDSHHYDVC